MFSKTNILKRTARVEIDLKKEVGLKLIVIDSRDKAVFGDSRNGPKVRGGIETILLWDHPASPVQSVEMDLK